MLAPKKVDRKNGRIRLFVVVFFFVLFVVVILREVAILRSFFLVVVIFFVEVVESWADRFTNLRAYSTVGVRPESLLLGNVALRTEQYLNVIGAPAAWNVSHGAGVDASHPDLAGKFVNTGRDMVNNDADASDDHGHGTHVSGIIGAATQLGWTGGDGRVRRKKKSS